MKPTKLQREEVAKLIIQFETGKIGYNDYREKLKELNSKLHSEDFLSWFFKKTKNKYNKKSKLSISTFNDVYIYDYIAYLKGKELIIYMGGDILTFIDYFFKFHDTKAGKFVHEKYTIKTFSRLCLSYVNYLKSNNCL